MNCNCCNCSNNNAISCEDEKRSKIKIYGTLVNVTLDQTLDDANCAADNQDYDTGHNDALAYAYQLHDGRFRADDEDLPAHERFQDAINKRVTDIVYDETGGGVDDDPITIIENPYTHDDNGDLVPIGACDCEPYDDAWLKDIIGTTPENEATAAQQLQSDFDEESGDIISYIRLLKQQICNLQEQIDQLSPSGDTCYWQMDSSDNYLMPKPSCGCQGVKGPGFYDTTVH